MKETMAKREPNAVTMPNWNPQPSHTKHFSGSNHEQFSLMLVNQVSRSIWTAHSDEDYKEKQLSSGLEAMVEHRGRAYGRAGRFAIKNTILLSICYG